MCECDWPMVVVLVKDRVPNTKSTPNAPSPKNRLVVIKRVVGVRVLVAVEVVVVRCRVFEGNVDERATRLEGL